MCRLGIAAHGADPCRSHVAPSDAAALPLRLALRDAGAISQQTFR